MILLSMLQRFPLNVSALETGVPFYIGNAIHYQDTNDSLYSSHPLTTKTDNITMETWVKADSISSAATNIRIMYNGNSSTSGYGIYLSGANKYPCILMGSVAFIGMQVPETIKTGVWYHLAAVRDNGIWKLYINGVEKVLNSNTLAPNLPTDSFSIGNNKLVPESFNGCFDEVRFWSVARTGQQIRDNMYMKLTGNEAGLLAYYNFDQPGITPGGINTGILEVQDLAGGDHNLALSGFAKEGLYSNFIQSVQLGQFQFENANYSVREYLGSVRVAIIRTGGSEGTVTINYSTSNGTAMAGTNYTTTGGSIYFAEGETRKEIDIPIIDNQISETRTFTMAISALQGVSLGVNNIASINVDPRESYTVTFKDHDDTTIKTQTVRRGDSAIAPANPVRIGHTFAGWSAGYTNVTSDLTITAQYTINQYTVTFKDHDNTTLKTQTVMYGGSAAAPQVPVRSGYTFTGWSTAYDNITEDLTVTAQYTVKELAAPAGVTAEWGDSMVALNWNSVAEATGYKIYKTTVSGSYGLEIALVDGSVNSFNALGLTNGLTYYFVVKAVNAEGDGTKSDEVSAIPKSVPGTPINVTAVAGNGQATVTFTAPLENGGSSITGYIVTSYPDNIIVNGNSTSITVTGLMNGITYRFKVKAVNEVGEGEDSIASNEVRPYKPSNVSIVIATPTSEPAKATETKESTKNTEPTKPIESGIDILVNGIVETAAVTTTTKLDDKTITKVIIDDKKVEEKLIKEGNNSVITIPVKNDADIVVGTLNGQTVKNMEIKEAVLEVKTETVTYTLPASQINIDEVSKQIGKQIELKNISVNVKISEPPKDKVKIVENTANKNNYQVVVKPIEFEITCSNDNKTVEVSKFNSYVERMVAIPEGIDPSKITTGIVLNNDGTFSHVPTTIAVIDGRYYAKINSLTNSTYSVIWSPKIYKDVENHWAKDAVNDMGSRIIIDGVEDNNFEPDRSITRAEFASIVIRSLGLMRSDTGKDVFSDVTKDSIYYEAISIAHEYGIITGYGNEKFGPMDKITREQAFTVIARAMKITKLKAEVKDSEIEGIIGRFGDLTNASEWAQQSVAACINIGIVSGKSQGILDPRDETTRAEVATIVRQLLKKSGLI